MRLLLGVPSSAESEGLRLAEGGSGAQDSLSASLPALETLWALHERGWSRRLFLCVRSSFHKDEALTTTQLSGKVGRFNSVTP